MSLFLFIKSLFIFILILVRIQALILVNTEYFTNGYRGTLLMTTISGSKHSLSPIDRGAEVIQGYLSSLEERPGVYRMLDINQNVLYVGKAKNVKKRVFSYTQPQKLPNRLQRMIAHTTSMEFLYTYTETEALLLECNLIKTLNPKYNILLKDDKSFSYIKITRDHPYPLITKHRGAKTQKADYFGPFPSSSAVYETITALQKAFMLRNCQNSVFKTRTRPCLQYYIKRCTAPCVKKVTVADYAEQVNQATDFLSGKSSAIKDMLTEKMMQASKSMDYEKAAQFRDKIKALAAIQAHQNINLEGIGDLDVIAHYRDEHETCVQILFFRNGNHFGNRVYFPLHTDGESDEAILSAFIGQFYTSHTPPKEICVSVTLPDKALLEEALKQTLGKTQEKNIKIITPQKGAKLDLLASGVENAKAALLRKQSMQLSQDKLMLHLQKTFGLPSYPKRIEVYDNSHIQGTHPIGAMIVATHEGFQKNAYRKFNIQFSEKTNDDYAMMREVLTRRFSGSLSNSEDETNNLPDLLLIDGGKGQLSIAMNVLDTLNLSHIPIISIAKGPDRNSGDETFFMRDREGFHLTKGDPILFFLERLRDEAHRFVITSHRSKREKKMFSSALDAIPGIGPARKKALLHYFGSAKGVESASLQELQKVEGISANYAKKIYDYFH